MDLPPGFQAFERCRGAGIHGAFDRHVCLPRPVKAEDRKLRSRIPSVPRARALSGPAVPANPRSKHSREEKCKTFGRGPQDCAKFNLIHTTQTARASAEAAPSLRILCVTHFSCRAIDNTTRRHSQEDQTAARSRPRGARLATSPMRKVACL